MKAAVLYSLGQADNFILEEMPILIPSKDEFGIGESFWPQQVQADDPKGAFASCEIPEGFGFLY